MTNLIAESVFKSGSEPIEVGIGFTPSELRSGFSEWEKIATSREVTLRSVTQKWLGAWRAWDLACSPMPDDDRRRIRYGHYLGWHAAF